MNKIARRLTRSGAIAAVALSAAAALALPGSAMATSSGLKIAVTSSYGLTNGSTTTYVANTGVTYGITYTLTSSQSGVTLTQVGFTDQLPSGVVLDDEVGETAKGCGTPFNPTNQAGQSSVTESGLTVANGNSCTVTLEYVANTPELAAQDTITNVTYNGTQSGTPASLGVPVTPLSLTVAGLPTVSIAGVTNGATYTPGQAVDLSYSATAAANDAIAPGGLYAFDDQGNTLTNGQAVNTQVPGSHSVQVWVQTQDDYLGSQTVNYTVKSPSLTAVSTTKTGHVLFNVEFLAAGTITAEAVDGKTVVGKLTEKVVAGRNTRVTLTPTAAGKRLLTPKKSKTKSKNKKKKPKQPVIKVVLSVAYTAANWTYTGTAPVITKSGIKLS